LSKGENTLKLTLDSSEPLEDAMRVVGALYGVTLVVSSDEQDASKPAPKNATKRAKTETSRRRTSPVKKSASKAPATQADAGKSQKKAASRPASSPSNVAVRSWARQNGLMVSDRGRVPAAVLDAYRNAQNN
jgi:hypothetical protein